MIPSRPRSWVRVGTNPRCRAAARLLRAKRCRRSRLRATRAVPTNQERYECARDARQSISGRQSRRVRRDRGGKSRRSRRRPEPRSVRHRFPLVVVEDLMVILVDGQTMPPRNPHQSPVMRSASPVSPLTVVPLAPRPSPARFASTRLRDHEPERRADRAGGGERRHRVLRRVDVHEKAEDAERRGHATASLLAVRRYRRRSLTIEVPPAAPLHRSGTRAEPGDAAGFGASRGGPSRGRGCAPPHSSRRAAGGDDLRDREP